MSHEHHDWKLGSDPPLIRPHSQAKHRVLRAYLERYVSVLTARIQQDSFRLTLIDGFAGGGRYLDVKSKEERPGSPLIMLQAMEQAAEDAQKVRTKPFNLDVRYIFIEKDQEALDYLRQVLEESKYAPLVGERIQLMRGEFTAKAAEVTKFVRERGRAGRAAGLSADPAAQPTRQGLERRLAPLGIAAFSRSRRTRHPCEAKGSV